MMFTAMRTSNLTEQCYPDCYGTNKPEACGRSQANAFVFTAWGLSAPPFYSNKMPVGLREAQLPDCTHASSFNDFTVH